jgi:hypothetical protein
LMAKTGKSRLNRSRIALTVGAAPSHDEANR